MEVFLNISCSRCCENLTNELISDASGVLSFTAYVTPALFQELERHESAGFDQFPAEFIKAGVERFALTSIK
jgi:hypothetical protein